MIDTISIHKVGNKQTDNRLILSERPVMLDPEVKSILESYFTKHFKYEEIFRFFDMEDLNENGVYGYVSAIFDNPDTFHEQSAHLAQLLFDCTENPKIKSGEFYVAYFNEISYRNEVVKAVGLFKTEQKETFLQVYPKNESFAVESHEGIGIKKLDKGCIIYDVDRENGYHVVAVDNVNKSQPTQFWMDDFLQVKQIDNSYFKTEQTMSLCKNFVTEMLPEEFEVSRIDQSDLLQRSIDFFKENEQYEQEMFCSSVLKDPELVESFESYKMEYESDYDIDLAENFSINENAVKKQNRYFKSVIKLDKNFHIYVHGDRSKIAKMEDSKGKFYKIYFEEEK